MEFLLLLFCVCPATVTSISISPNGNSPEIKMVGGMMVDVQKGFVPMTMAPAIADSKRIPLEAMEKSSSNNYDKSKTYTLNATALSANERYRRLIPYMTFYYANDLTGPTTESYTKTIEVEKVQIEEMAPLERQPKKINHFPYRNIPRYHGNRLTHYNIASANPTKIYKYVTNQYHPSVRVTPNYNNYLSEYSPEGHDFRRPVHNPSIKYNPSYSIPTRKPYLNLYQNEDFNNGNVQYYIPEKDSPPKFKLVPYEQTPPVKVVHQNEDLYDIPNRAVPVPVIVPKEQVHIKPRPTRPQYNHDNVFVTGRKPPAIISESYYEKLRPHEFTKPVVESGFQPITGSHVVTTETYSQTVPEPVTSHYDIQQQVHVIDNDGRPPQNRAPNHYEYIVEKPAYQHVKTSTYQPAVSNIASLGDLLNSLQLNKSIPKPITRDNVGASIRTLLQVLNTLKAVPQHNEVDTPVLSTPKPFAAQKVIVPEPEIVEEVRVSPAQSVEQITESILPNEVELDQEPYLAPVNVPSQHLDDYSPGRTTSQRFPLRQENDEEGGTPGRPGVDYPTLELIPPTQFDCKTQRYKGFFADPETRCQVWHYCDLNGGQASFLCPNGTIFSQAGLTCDWWFNVRCASTAQLYVLNESLYKFILPHSPKFPEDYSGPLVDKYLTLKFKEMEEQFRKNRKNKQSAAEKIDSEETEESEEKREEEEVRNDDVTSVSESSVVVGSPGTTGNVERLQD